MPELCASEANDFFFSAFTDQGTDQSLDFFNLVLYEATPKIADMFILSALNFLEKNIAYFYDRSAAAN
jgi:hypothetical protein